MAGATEEAEARRTETEDIYSPILKENGFNPSLMDELKAGIAAASHQHKDPSITHYILPQNIYKLEPLVYLSRNKQFCVPSNFKKALPNDQIRTAHVMQHVGSILARNPTYRFEDYLMAMIPLKERIKKCHYVRIRMDFKSLVWITIFGCFLVDVLLLVHEGKLSSLDGTCTAWKLYLWTDMLLVQNQLPFFVLQQIFDMAITDKSTVPSLVQLSLNFFDEFLERDKEVPLMEPGSVHHLLHLVHHHLVPPRAPKPLRHKINLRRRLIAASKTIRQSESSPQLPTSNPAPPSQTVTIFPIPTARRLQDVGIKLKKKEGRGFLEITFHKGVLQIPRLYVHSNTRILLRNLIAWEQCHRDAGPFFTSYGIFMDYIINTAKDVEILIENGIIEHSLGSEEEVAAVFNGLGTNLVLMGLENDFLPEISRELHQFCQNDFNKWKAKLMTDYFGSPWAIISVVAGVILLILTFIQTFFAAYGYFRPP